ADADALRRARRPAAGGTGVAELPRPVRGRLPRRAGRVPPRGPRRGAQPVHRPGRPGRAGDRGRGPPRPRRAPPGPRGRGPLSPAPGVPPVIDLRAARADPDRFRAALARKGAAEAFDALLAADARWRELLRGVEELRARPKPAGRPTPAEVEQLKLVKAELGRAEAELATAEAARDAALGQVPNPPHASAPAAADGPPEADAGGVRGVGDPRALAAPRDHVELGRFDMERAARVSGARFGYMIGDTALLALAVYRLALDRLVARGFTPVLPPVLVREDAMYGTGFFPTDAANVYPVERDGLYLVGTSEGPVGARHRGEIREAERLPLRYAGFSTCFRREAGAAGRDTRGMFRVHQFNKVEMFVFTTPEASWDEHERLLAVEEALLQELELPY